MAEFKEHFKLAASTSIRCRPAKMSRVLSEGFLQVPKDNRKWLLLRIFRFVRDNCTLVTDIEASSIPRHPESWHDADDDNKLSDGKKLNRLLRDLGSYTEENKRMKNNLPIGWVIGEQLNYANRPVSFNL